jgi:hypothetical protein
MTWQDELRRLEDDLVNGRVSAEEYRIRRDQLLSSANTTPQEQPQQPAGAEHTQVISPVSPQGAPQQQQQAPSPGHNVDADRTQAVSRNTFAQGNQDADRTQVVSPAAYQGRPPQQQQQDEAPPWAGNEFPPLVGATSSDWTKQGPEAFGGQDKKPSKGKIFGVIGAVVVVVILVVGAILLFTKGSDNKQAGGAGTSASAQPAAPAQPLGIADPPGTQEAHPDVTTLDTMKKANYLNPEEEQAYANAVVTTMVFKVGRPGPDATIAVVGAQAGSPQGAQQAAKSLNDIQITNKMQEGKNPPKSVYVAQSPKKPGAPASFRAHFAHGSTIIRVDATGKDFAAVQQQFKQALDAQLKATPADG